MTTVSILNAILKELKAGNLNSITIDNSILINNTTMELLKLSDHTVDQVAMLGLIVGISNILYNNTDRVILPLEDGVYDILLALYKRHNPRYQVGAEPIQFAASAMINTQLPVKHLVNPLIKYGSKEDCLFYEDLIKKPKLNRADFLVRPIIKTNALNRRSLNTPHLYPELAGTLDKCKFVLNSQAVERGVFDDPNVAVFERDVIQRDIQSGLIDPDRIFYLVLELKSDGVAVVAKVAGNKILYATGRGDTNNNITTDLTPILEGYRFRHADEIPKDNEFGIQFEAVITYDNLYRLNQLNGKEYKNCRNAIIGILSSSDANVFRDYITLIPLATSLGVDRLTEIEFLNKYYNTGEYLRYSVIKGNYKEILFQVKKFVEEAEHMRAFLPYMYDGVVVSYIEPDLIDALGRQNSVNKYSTAIKFNAMKKQTIFLGYTYTVGQNGVVTPMIHYNPVEFYGTIHNKSTGHSYKRFRELSLKQGDIVSVEYTNDVMPYVTKLDLNDNITNPNEVVEFIKICPSCGNILKESDSGKSIICDNIKCTERNINRMVNMLQKLNLKDFSEESLRSIAKFSLSELFALTIDDVRFLGELTSQKFMERIRHLKETPIFDYKIVGALGFSSIAVEKWKLILNHITIDQIIQTPHELLKQTLVSIKGIGPMAADTICTEREFFLNDLMTINNMTNIIPSIGAKFGKSIRFTGIRDKTLTDELNSRGHDANDSAGVTKTTDILVVPYDGYVSSKTAKAGPETIIVSHSDFTNNINKYL